MRAGCTIASPCAAVSVMRVLVVALCVLPAGNVANRYRYGQKVNGVRGR